MREWRFDGAPPGWPAPGECHLWVAAIRADATPGDLADAAERVQAERFRHDGARSTYVVSRLAQRAVLGRYLGIDPAHVEIDRTCAFCGDPYHGRPTVKADGLEYSVSHSGDWCLIAVASMAVGVDIERVATEMVDVDPLAARTLGAMERDAFAAVEPPDRAAWFYRAWARKEAAAKATGGGLRVEMPTIDVQSAITRADGAELWLRDLDVPSGYAGALATGSPVERLIAARAPSPNGS